MYCSVESALRCPANVAIACSSQPIRAGSVKHSCRVVSVEDRGRLAANATHRTTFDHVHNVTGSAWLRRNSDRNKPPRARLSVARCAVVKQLRPLRSATITINGASQTRPSYRRSPPPRPKSWLTSV